MSRRHGGKLPPFTSLFRHTTNSAAWAALSVGARAAFFELQSNYNTNRQNTVFLSARTGSKKLNAHKDTVAKWMRELEHYGFIVAMQRAHLGFDGAGKATLYRLTDRPYASKSPTYDFQNWTGEFFEPQKQNPVRLGRTPRPKKPDIRGELGMAESTKKCPTEPDIRNAAECPNRRDIYSFTSSLEFIAATALDYEEADSPFWVDAWLEQGVPQPTLSMAEIRQAMGYRQ